MSKYTLLELTQQIASSLGSDEITSINDSTESLQIAYIVRRAYFDLIKRLDIPEHCSLLTLTETSSVSPTVMKIPAGASEIKWIKYNKIVTASDPDTWELVEPLPVNSFLDRMHLLNTDNSNVGTFSYSFDNSAIDVYYTNDKQPSYYTLVDDYTILFDSYDVDLENYLQSVNSLGYVKLVIPFSVSDNATPDLDEENFALLLNEATSLAWAELKQTAHPIAERNSKRGWTHLQRTKNNVTLYKDLDLLPNFGRK